MTTTFTQVFDTSAGKFRELKTSDLGSNVPGRFRDAFEVYEPGAGRWIENLAPGDLTYADGNAAAASYLVVSKSPWSVGQETAIELDAAYHFRMPVEVAVALSMSQRTLGQEFAVEVVDTSAPLPNLPDQEILTISQSAGTLTVTTRQPHGHSVGKSVGIAGVADSRVNYPAVVVGSVPSPVTFTATAGPGGNLPSITSFTTSALVRATNIGVPTYANGTLGVGATLTAAGNGAFPQQDGITVPLGGRVLVTTAADNFANGLYVLTQLGDAGTPWILTRAPELDTTAELTVVAGARHAVSVYVEQGVAWGQRQFVLGATVTTVGTTAVDFPVLDLPRQGLGRVFFRERLGRANNGLSLIFENTTPTNASLYVRSESGDALPSGTIPGNHSTTVATSVSTQLVNSPYTYAFGASSLYTLLVQSDRVQWQGAPVDSTAQPTGHLTRTQVCPDPNETYKFRIRATGNKSLTAPIAQIVTGVKTGTTTATITLDRDIEFERGDLMLIYGMRAQGAAEFPNLIAATPVANAIDNRTFDIVIGTAGTITSVGGYVARVHGGNLMSVLGAVAQTVQSATLSTLADGTRQLVLIGSAAWASPANTIGDLLELIGCRADPGGASLGVDGPWKIAAVAGTSLTMVLPFTGQRALPADFATTNCGGGLIKRTDLRVPFVRIFDYERFRIEAVPRPAGDAAGGMPVSVQGGSVGVSSLPALPAGANNIGIVQAAGTVAADAAVGNPFVTAVAARNVNAAPVGATGRVQHWVGTMIGVGITKPYSIPEADWQTPVSITNSAAAAPVREAPAAGIRNYITALDLVSDPLTNATELRLRENDIAANSQTIASNTLVLSATHNFGVGDAVVASASNVTGLIAGTMYYVQATPAAASLVLSATRGGAALAISGTGVSATLHKVLWQTRIPTAGRPADQVTFPTPLRASPAAPVLLQTVTASGAGTVTANVQGYVAP